jgi:ABC-2 type transport system permease protein
MILRIAQLELHRLLISPLAWGLLAAIQLIMAWAFLTHVELFLNLQPRLSGIPNAPGITDLVVGPTLGSAAIVLLFFLPLLTMRLFAGERAQGTLTLLLAAPITSAQMVLGKYLGAVAYLLLLIVLISAMPLSLLLGGSLDFGQLASGLLGLLLIGALFVAIGLAFSTFTVQPGGAAVGALALLGLLWMIGSQENSGVLAYLGLLKHYQPFLSGLVRSADLAYFALGILAALTIAIWRLELSRLVP